jgi:hypothetical protein
MQNRNLPRGSSSAATAVRGAAIILALAFSSYLSGEAGPALNYCSCAPAFRHHNDGVKNIESWLSDSSGTA